MGTLLEAIGSKRIQRLGVQAIISLTLFPLFYLNNNYIKIIIAYNKN